MVLNRAAIHPYQLTGKGVLLRAPQPKDYEKWSNLREISRDFLQPWEPTWPVDDLSRVGFKRRYKQLLQEYRQGQSYPFYIFEGIGQKLLGGITLTNVRHGVCKSGCLGYWMGKPYAGKGYMKKAVERIISFAFEELHLHRVEANCIPTNEVSIGLLERVGFEREGYARSFLFINGQWQDHVLLAKIAEETNFSRSLRNRTGRAGQQNKIPEPVSAKAPF